MIKIMNFLKFLQNLFLNKIPRKPHCAQFCFRLFYTNFVFLKTGHLIQLFEDPLSEQNHLFYFYFFIFSIFVFPFCRQNTKRRSQKSKYLKGKKQKNNF